MYTYQEMENYQGDLTDILRATSGSLSQQPDFSSCWEFDRPPLITTTTTTSSHAPLLEEATGGRVTNPASDFFGDPFCNMRDPLLHELNIPTSTYFDDSATTTTTTIKVNEGSCNNINMFSRIQISPAPNKSPLLSPPPPPQRSSDNNNNNNNNRKSPLRAAMASPSPAGFKVAAAASGLVLSDRIINVSSSKSCLIDGPVQISSPRNLGIKRRKSQAKKVVCIPAPAAPNSRPSGEVVPSDLWAWRKYGQKPIKGSPYPRGYYRCSSSKGCPARKQVERSRTDPNMLVITYTSEHNHPWPTQRNALAGSTRAQPPKTNNVGSKISSPTTSHMKEETSNEEAALSPHNNNNIGSGGASSSAQVKEEVEEDGKRMADENVVLDEGFSYRPAMPDQDFFAQLGEIDGDPLGLLLSSSQGFINEEDVQKQGNKGGGGGLDPFGLFDWPSVDCQSSAPFGEARRGL